MAQANYPPSASQDEPERVAPTPISPIRDADARAEVGEALKSNSSNRMLADIAILVLALHYTGFSLRSETQKSAALGREVAGLEAELLTVQATVSAHQTRLEAIRDEVSSLLSRIGDLSSLVAADVIPRQVKPAPHSPSDE